MVKRALLILNPTARGAPPREWLREGIDALDGWEATISQTESAGHAIELARDAAANGMDAVVACGGDGTVNEVANGLAGSQTAMAVVRGGTANVWSKEIKLPRKPADAVRLLSTGERRVVDLGRAVYGGGADGESERYFLLMAGIGFDASIVRQASGALKRRLGAAAYLLQGARSVFSHRAVAVELLVDGAPLSASLYWLLVGNTRSYAGLVSLTHQAAADDGRLDFCLLEQGGLPRIAWLLPWVLLRRHHQRAHVRYRPVESLEVRTAGLPVQVDGEYLTETPIRIEVAPRALQVIVPAELNSPLFTSDAREEP
ncbi:MAG: diacylglycerol kinase family lipid kinase [Chloroflexi bacterium]|nr:diacylglycerol kinase family lipid kinase [Chloroflexota bacterium]